MDETSKAPVDTRIRRRRNASERKAFVAGVGRKLRFVVLVHLPPGMDEGFANKTTGDVIEKENVRAGNCNKQVLSGPLITGTRQEVTIDAARKDPSKDLVVHFSGDVFVAKKTDLAKNKVIHVQNPLEVELDRDVFVKLRDLFLLLTRALGITYGTGSISLGNFSVSLTLTDGRLMSEHDLIVEINKKDVVAVSLTEGSVPDRSN